MRYKVFGTWLRIGILVGALMLGGCGKQNTVEDMYQNLNQNISQNMEQTVAENSVVTVEKEAEKEKVQFTVTESNGNEYNVDVTLKGDVMGKMGIYEVEEQKVTDEYLKAYAESLFDGGSYTVSVVESYMPKELLEEEIRYYENQPDEVKKNCYSRLNDLRMELDLYDEAKAITPNQEQIIYEIVDDDLPRPITAPSKLYCARLVGYVDGVRTAIIYNNLEYGEEVHIESDLSAQEYTHSPIAIDNPIFQDNQCDIAVARTMAQDYLDKIGMQDFKEAKVSINWRMSGAVTGNWFVDGFIFEFGRELDGKQEKPFANGRLYKVEDLKLAKDVHAHLEKLSVAVTSDGVEEVVFSDIVKNVEKKNDAVNFLSMNQVVESAKEAFENFSFYEEQCQRLLLGDLFTNYLDIMGSNSGESFKIENLELCYMPIRYENHVTMEPIWIFSGGYSWYGNQGESPVDVAYLGVNAIDGSVVVFDITEIIPTVIYNAFG